MLHISSFTCNPSQSQLENTCQAECRFAGLRCSSCVVALMWFLCAIEAVDALHVDPHMLLGSSNLRSASNRNQSQFLHKNPLCKAKLRGKWANLTQAQTNTNSMA